MKEPNLLDRLLKDIVWPDEFSDEDRRKFKLWIAQGIHILKAYGGNPESINIKKSIEKARNHEAWCECPNPLVDDVEPFVAGGFGMAICNNCGKQRI